MSDDVTFSAGSADFAERKNLAPWHEDPRAMFRTVAGLAGAPGMAQAGMGMLGGAARAVDPVQRMFGTGGVGAGMLSGLGIGSAAAAEGGALREQLSGDLYDTWSPDARYRTDPDLMTLGKGPQEEDQRIKINAGPYGPGKARRPVDMATWSDEELARAANGRDPSQAVRAANEIRRRFRMRGEEMQRMQGKRAGMLGEMMAARPSGAGDRRDKRLRDAEDRDTRTG